MKHLEHSPKKTDSARSGWRCGIVLFALAVGVSALALSAPTSAAATEIHNLLYNLTGSETPAGHFFSAGIAVDNSASASSGDLYVGDASKSVVDKYSPSSTGATYLCQLSGLGSLAGHPASECDTSSAGPGRFESVRGIAVDPSSGLVYVTDPTLHRVYEFTPGGAYTGKQLDLGSGSAQRLDVSAATGNVFVADETAERVVEWDPAAETTSTFSTGTPTGSFADLRGVAVDNDPSSPNYKDVYVVDAGNGSVDRFSAGGAYQCQITGAGSATTSASECDSSHSGVPAGNFTGLTGAIAVDPSNGHVYLADDLNALCNCSKPKLIYEFGPFDEYLASISTPPIAPSGAWRPWALSISGESGDVFVASLNNPDEVYVFGPDKPLPATGSATNVTPASATLTGSVNPLGSEVSECSFEYVAAAEYQPGGSEPYGAGGSVPCLTESDSTEIGGGESPVSVHADLSGLEPGTVYHYRLAAANANGRSVGSDRFFGPPAVDGEGVGEIEQTSVRLTGLVNPDDLETSYRFEYGEPNGPAGSYQHSAPVPDGSVGDGAEDVPVSQVVSGLKVGATYHYRLLATSSDGTAAGADRVFSTLPATLIDAQPAASIGTTKATLQAYLNPLGTATSYRFEWGDQAEFEADEYDHATPTESGGEGAEPALAEASLEGLQPATQYHFRLVAESSKGTVDGPDEAFTTEAASCANEMLREENDSTALPQCRAYEQVSPTDKGGAAVDSSEVAGHSPFAAAIDGERAWFLSFGFFAGNPGTGLEYISQRSAAGWRTTSDNVPWAYLERSSHFHSPDLAESIMKVEFGERFSASVSQWALFLDREEALRQASPTAEMRLGGPRGEPGESNPQLIGTSEDFSTAIVESHYALLPEDHLPESFHQGATHIRLYEVAGVGGPSPTLRLLQIAPDGSQLDNCAPGFGANLGSYAIDQHGTAVFFSCSDNQVYARLDGSRTVAVSEPEPNAECTTGACRSAVGGGAAFAGASADGTRAYFLSARQLTDEAGAGSVSATQNGCTAAAAASDPNGCNLYLYDFNRPSGHHLLAVSAGETPGEGPRVQGVTRVSSDGSRVYFVAQGLLTSQPNSLGQRARSGADNLYVYDADAGSLAFVAELCSGEERSGTLTAARCSGDDSEAMWGGQQNMRNFTTPDGSVLAFTTHARLTPDDENEAADVYRYDARSGALARVSVGHDGFGSDGNAGGYDARLFSGVSQKGPELQASLTFRSMSDDGSTIVFSTARPLQQGAENGHADAYLWHQGEVSLVSGAKSATNLPQDVVTTTSGRDVFFLSDEGLVPGDRDGVADIYDARVGGGFALPPPPPPACESDESCHGPGTEPAPAPNITHVAGPPNPLQCHRGFVKRSGRCVRKHSHRHHRHRRAHTHRGGRK